MLYNRHRQSLPAPRHPHPCKSVLLTAGPAPEPGTRSELLGLLVLSSLPTEESDCVPAGSVGDTVMSLSWGPQLISRAGLPKPTSILTHSLDSSHSPSFPVSAPRERDQNQSHGGVSKRLRRSSSPGVAGEAGRSSISPLLHVRGTSPGA